MKSLVLFICLLAQAWSCKPAGKLAGTTTTGLDTITNINQVPKNAKAVLKTEGGEYFVMRHEADPVDSMALVVDSSEAALAPPAANNKCDSENFDGVYRSECKITSSNATIRNYNKLSTFISSLRPDAEMANYQPAINRNTLRVAEEDRNVKIKTAYLYCYARQTDEDFHLIIGTTDNPSTAKYFNVEISGLPATDAVDFAALEAARNAFLAKADKKLCGSGYYFFDAPLKVELRGSLFFDREHYNEAIGPASARPKTAWEIHPVTYFKYK